MNSLPHRSRAIRILLGVGAGEALQPVGAQTLALARGFVDAGAELRVVRSAAAAPDATPAALQALTGHEPRAELFDAAHEAAMGHIELARWPDAIVLAPAPPALRSAMAAGLAGDLLTTLLLATDKPVFVCRHDVATPHDRVLTARGIHFIEPSEPAPSQVLQALRDLEAPAAQPLAGLRAVVTAGPTREPIDPVRFITNRSSGKQGFAVARALQAAGARVTLIAGPSALQSAAGIERVDVETAQQMLDASLQAAAGADLLVAAAAVADYRVQTVASEKARNTGEALTLQLVKNADILASLRERYPALFLVGFAAETERLAEHARGKLVRKGLDLIAANWVGNGRAFDTEDNALTVFWADGEREIATAGKAEVARQLVVLIAERLALRTGR